MPLRIAANLQTQNYQPIAFPKGLGFILILAPLLFGAVHTFVYSFFCMLSAILLMGWFLKTKKSPQYNNFNLKKIRFTLLCWGIVILWAIIQTAPFVLKSLAHPLWLDIGETLNINLSATISLNPSNSWTVIMRFLSYFAVFFLSLQYSKNSKNAQKIFLTVIITAAICAFYGLINEFYDLRHILWKDKLYYLDSLTGTFVNKNHFATYLGMALICVFAVIFNDFFKFNSGSNSKIKFREMIDDWGINFAYFLVVICVLLSALLLTNSRAGLVFSFIAIATLFILATIKKYLLGKKLLLSAILFGVITLFFVNLSGKVMLNRMGHASDDLVNRQAIYALTGDAISDAPLIGTGLGTFADVFNLYKRNNFANVVYTESHNSYLENALELGIPCAVILYIGFLPILWHLIIGVKTRHKNAMYPATGIALTLLVFLHSMVDFSMQIPAVAFTYFILLGTSLAQSFSSKEEKIN